MEAECALCGAKAQRQFTEIVGGRRRSMSLCLDCASRQGLAAPPPRKSRPPAFKVKLQAQVLGGGLPSTTLRCPECGIRLVELRKSGRVGCASCYQVFLKQILPLLRRVHGATAHTGMRPQPVGSEPDIAILREELRRAIEAEDFEQAARLRDRIGSHGKAAAEDSGQDHE